MKKIINVKPVTELELQFESGETLSLRFDVKAISNFNEIEGGINDFLKEMSMPEMCAKVIYIAGVSNNSELTLERARVITSNLDPMTITEIMTEFNISMGSGKNEVQKEIQKKLMEQFLAQMK